MTERFMLQRNDLRAFRWAESPATALDDGEVRLRIDAFALTSNNITYAAFGDAMNYWAVLPHRRSRDRLRSGVGFRVRRRVALPGVEVGERFYGYWPIGDDVVLQAEAVHPGGFTDGAEHRRDLASDLQPVRALQRRSRLRGGPRTAAGVASPPVRDVVPDRRFPRGQRVLRCHDGGAVQCVQQDRLRHGFLPGAAARHRRSRHGHRAHVARAIRVHPRPGLLRRGAVLRRHGRR